MVMEVMVPGGRGGVYGGLGGGLEAEGVLWRACAERKWTRDKTIMPVAGLRMCPPVSTLVNVSFYHHPHYQCHHCTTIIIFILVIFVVSTMRGNKSVD